MREINAKDITEQVKRLCMEANSYLPEDIKERINKSEQEEPWALAKSILGIIHENYLIAEENYVPVCQDTGMACVFMEIGQDVHINGNLEEAVNEGVRQGYTEGCLRKSVVRDPLDRVNTTDNTPAMIYYDIVPGDGFKLTVAPKGFGSENMSQIKMLKPSDGLQGPRQNRRLPHPRRRSRRNGRRSWPSFPRWYRTATAPIPPYPGTSMMSW